MASVITAGTTSTTALNLTGDTSGELQIKTNNGSTTAMTLTTGGNVGVGTTSPTSISGYTVLEVNGNTSGAVLDLAQGDVMRGRLVAAASSFAIETSGSIPIGFVPGGTERMRITSTGNVGIGTSSPANILSLRASSPQIDFVTTAADDTSASIQGSVDTGTGGKLVFITKRNGNTAVEQMRIDSAGNVGIGVTPSAWQSIYKVLQLPSASFIGRNDGGIEAEMLANAYRDSAGTRRYVANGVALRYQQSSDGHAFFTAGSGTAGNAITFTQAMTLDSSGRLLVGKTSPTANGGDIQVSTGITFPATQVAASDANTLDDYEEGTFTPSYTSAGISAVTYGTGRNGYYTKVGRMVTIIVNIMTDSVTVTNSSASVTLTGLPFTASSLTEINSSTGLTVTSRFNANPPAGGIIGRTQSQVTLYRSVNTTADDPPQSTVSDFRTGAGNVNTLRFTATYFTD
jgi:hypothetical protein